MAEPVHEGIPGTAMVMLVIVVIVSMVSLTFKLIVTHKRLQTYFQNCGRYSL
jgi:hypothetical protein